MEYAGFQAATLQFAGSERLLALNSRHVAQPNVVLREAGAGRIVLHKRHLKVLWIFWHMVFIVWMALNRKGEDIINV